jgi:hypothetical protein
VLVLAGAAAGASGQAAPRLEGTWSVSMRFTAADGLRDRKVGQRVAETWAFRPRCKQGACDVVLRRAGRSISLRRDGATYRGRGSFAGSVTCSGRVYPAGTIYTETWVVQARRPVSGPRGLRATRIRGAGTTVGRSRASLPCARVVSREVVALSGSPRS